ncbi:hypothetical protein SETIT_5G112800v2 [Setaria italica]|uniref:Uncharacterized protein n=1 Tax=Setaria italica TaxID=4555 RepID=A0A368R3K5_SETIT|nr:hypothetical protein SETIT_5G112800v2 [Setaria italica]
MGRCRGRFRPPVLAFHLRGWCVVCGWVREAAAGCRLQPGLRPHHHSRVRREERSAPPHVYFLCRIWMDCGVPHLLLTWKQGPRTQRLGVLFAGGAGPVLVGPRRLCRRRLDARPTLSSTGLAASTVPRIAGASSRLPRFQFQIVTIAGAAVMANEFPYGQVSHLPCLIIN